MDALLWADFQTAPAADTAFRVIKKLSGKALAFRIVAPPAVKTASFEKDGGSDSIPIVDGKFLNIDDVWKIHNNLCGNS